jgi:hypothetical protein
MSGKAGEALPLSKKEIYKNFGSNLISLEAVGSVFSKFPRGEIKRFLFLEG